MSSRGRPTVRGGTDGAETEGRPYKYASEYNQHAVHRENVTYLRMPRWDCFLPLRIILGRAHPVSNWAIPLPACRIIRSTGNLPHRLISAWISDCSTIALRVRLMCMNKTRKIYCCRLRCHQAMELLQLLKTWVEQGDVVLK